MYQTKNKDKKFYVSVTYKQQKDKLIASLSKIDPTSFKFGKWSEVHNKYHKHFLIREFTNKQELSLKCKEKLYKFILDSITSRSIKTADIDMKDSYINAINRLIIDKTGNFRLIQLESDEFVEHDTVKSIPLINMEWNKYVQKQTKQADQCLDNYSSFSVSSTSSNVDNSLEISAETLPEEDILPGIMDDSMVDLLEDIDDDG